MDTVAVSMDEVLRAAEMRAASLVPETSGYLALAVADASLRLPYRVTDQLVTLSTEGTVKVTRGQEIVAPEESARVLRSVLSRLLERSVGSMPALNATARERAEAVDGVEGFVAELEAALVPVNRAAARRALARLARETAKAKGNGKLRRRKGSRQDLRQRELAAKEAQELAATNAVAATPSRHREPVAPQKLVSEASVSRFEDVDEDIDDAIAVDIALEEELPREPTPTAIGLGAVEMLHRGARVKHAEDAHERSTDAPIEEAFVGDPTVIDADALAVALKATPSKTPEKRIKLLKGAEPVRRSDVDALLASFTVSDATPGGLQGARASLKNLAGLDPTPPPPRVAVREPVISVPTPRRSHVSSHEIVGSARRFSAMHVAFFALCIVLAGLLGHFVPNWLARADVAPETPSHLADR